MIDLYEKIINLIPSKSLKDEIFKSNFKIKDMDLVYIVDNYAFNKEEKINYLNALLKNDIDQNCKDKINLILSFKEDSESIWEESLNDDIDDISFKLIVNEYKPDWPIFLNKFDLVKVKPYFDRDNYHYAFITHFQSKSRTNTATVCLFESVKEEEINKMEEYEGEKYYVIPHNYSHDHIRYEEVEKVELELAPKNIRELYLKIMKGISSRVDINKYIYSDEIKKRLINHEFSDEEKASIIHMSIHPFNEKIKDLEELKFNTNNFFLFEQLSHYINVLKNIESRLRINDEKDLYELICPKEGEFYFKTYLEAYSYGLNKISDGSVFQIKKLRIGDEYYQGKIYAFNSKGEMIFTTENEFKGYKGEEDLFIYTYIDLPNIFKDDAYRIIKSRNYGFLDTSYSIIAENQEIIKREKVDGSDVGPAVYFIASDGDVFVEPYIDFVNMYFVPQEDLTLAMMLDLEYVRR